MTDIKEPANLSEPSDTSPASSEEQPDRPIRPAAIPKEVLEDLETEDEAPAASRRHVERPSDERRQNIFHDALMSQPSSALRKGTTGAEQEILEEREKARTLAEVFETFSNAQKEHMRQIPPENLVRNMAETEEVERGDAEEYLRLLHGDTKSEEEIQSLLARFDELRAEIQPAPEEERGNDFGTREDGTPITADEFVENNRDELERLGDKGRTIMNMQEGDKKQKAKEEWKASLTSILGENTAKALGKLLKFSTATTGILAILFLFLLSWHTPSK